ncbi:MAG: RHS repeat-associated core domain-containing protein [Candidatus Hydrogenedentes bacterium]|nr:RHS repeat-associated core domain-containing protein [Candidatus Hydrogenedentota bacterium]
MPCGISGAEWVYGTYIDEILAMFRDTDGQPGFETYFYLQDDLYNVIALTDANGAVVERYTYDDYGAPTVWIEDSQNPGTWIENAPNGAPVSDFGNPFMFTGRRWDEVLSLYDYRTRYYNPYLGRFLRIDTIGPWGDASNLGNPYAYVGNNPWSRLDPWGEWGLWEWLFGMPEAEAWDEQWAINKDKLAVHEARSNRAAQRGPRELDPRWAAYADPNSNVGTTTATESRWQEGTIGTAAVVLPIVVTAGEIVGEEIVFLPLEALTAGGVNPASRRSITTGGRLLLQQIAGRFARRNAGDAVEEILIPGVGWAVKRGDEVFVDTRQLSHAQLDELRRFADLGQDGVDRALRVARITPGSLPADEEVAVLNSLSHIDAGTKPTGALAKKWGVRFKNWGNDLPGGVGDASPYLEYRVAPASGTSGAGPRRIVVDELTGEIFYSWTHYGDTGRPAFVQIR